MQMISASVGDGGTNKPARVATVKTNTWAVSNLAAGDYLVFITARNDKGESDKSTPTLLHVEAAP